MNGELSEIYGGLSTLGGTLLAQIDRDEARAVIASTRDRRPGVEGVTATRGQYCLFKQQQFKLIGNCTTHTYNGFLNPIKLIRMRRTIANSSDISQWRGGGWISPWYPSWGKVEDCRVYNRRYRSVLFYRHSGSLSQFLKKSSNSAPDCAHSDCLRL